MTKAESVVNRLLAEESAEEELSKFKAYRGIGEGGFVKVCGWCPDKAQADAVAKKHGLETSHGMCPDCLTAYMKKSGITTPREEILSRTQGG